MSIFHFGLSYNISVFKLKISERGDSMYKRIRELREDRDLLQKDIAAYLHCTQVTYSRYELGLRDIPTQVLIALAKYHNTSVDYLLGLTDNKNKYK